MNFQITFLYEISFAQCFLVLRELTNMFVASHTYWVIPNKQIWLYTSSSDCSYNFIKIKIITSKNRSTSSLKFFSVLCC